MKLFSNNLSTKLQPSQVFTDQKYMMNRALSTISFQKTLPVCERPFGTKTESPLPLADKRKFNKNEFPVIYDHYFLVRASL